jgi:plasmid stabilization system protein ParE
MPMLFSRAISSCPLSPIVVKSSKRPVKPRIGRTVPEISNPDIRELIFKKYRIVHRINKNSQEILTVFEGHRLLRVDEVGT